MENHRIKVIILASFIFIISCGANKKIEEDTLKTTIYCVPNNMTTYNRGILTYYREYEDYGIKIEVDDKKFETELYKRLPKRPKSHRRSALRIKIVTSRNDTIFMPYLPKGRIINAGKSVQGNPTLLHLVVSKIKEKYSKGDFVCEGSECTKEIDQDDIDFMDVILKNCEEYINKEN